MITFEEAYEIVMASAIISETAEEVPFNSALNRIITHNIISDIDIPPFNKSAMDGYACRHADLKTPLKLIETIPAGKVPEHKITEGKCSKIMTGAIVPNGADCVIMVEFTESTDDGKIIFLNEKTSDNICQKGEDAKKGDIVLEKGKQIGSAGIAVMASVGCCLVNVAVQPKVGIIATGSELLEPNEKITDAKIRNSNSYQLCAQISQMGCIGKYYGIVEDSEQAINKVVKNAMHENNIIILSGGVSMGDFDLVPGVLKQNGFDFFFESVAMQPGRPTIFGINGKTYCWGLPGNPVSTFIIFEIMLKPFLYKLMGHNYRPLVLRLPLAKTVKRKHSKRRSAYPVSIKENKVIPLEYHGSAHINAMTLADGIINIPIGVKELPEGTIVDVRFI